MPDQLPSLRNAPNYYATDHFMYSDFICPCCDSLKIVPGFYTHLERLEELRNRFDKEIIVHSGYRCRSHNTEVGGSPRSWHLLFATDVGPSEPNPETLKELYNLAVELEFGGIGLYEKHIHLDIRPNAARWRG